MSKERTQETQAEFAGQYERDQKTLAFVSTILLSVYRNNNSSITPDQITECAEAFAVIAGHQRLTWKPGWLFAPTLRQTLDRVLAKNTNPSNPYSNEASNIYNILDVVDKMRDWHKEISVPKSPQPDETRVKVSITPFTLEPKDFDGEIL